MNEREREMRREEKKCESVAGGEVSPFFYTHLSLRTLLSLSLPLSHCSSLVGVQRETRSLSLLSKAGGQRGLDLGGLLGVLAGQGVEVSGASHLELVGAAVSSDHDGSSVLSIRAEQGEKRE